MCSNFRYKLHNAIDTKELPKRIIQCIFSYYIFFLHYIDGCIWSIVNYCTTSFTLLFCWKMTVIDKCVLCELFQNCYIDSTDAYINTIINFSGGFPGYPFFLFQCLIQVKCSLHMINIRIFPTLLFLCPSPF